MTFKIDLNKPFYAVSLVWNILRKFLPEQVTGQVKGMRAYKDMTGACFDVPEDYAQRIEDIFVHAQQEERVDFKVSKAKDLPELKED